MLLLPIALLSATRESRGEARRREETRARLAMTNTKPYHSSMPVCAEWMLFDARTVDARPPAPRPHAPGGIRRVSTVLELELRLPHAWPPGGRHVAPRLWGIAYPCRMRSTRWTRVGWGWVGSDEHPPELGESWDERKRKRGDEVYVAQRRYYYPMGLCLECITFWDTTLVDMGIFVSAYGQHTLYMTSNVLGQRLSANNERSTWEPGRYSRTALVWEHYRA